MRANQVDLLLWTEAEGSAIPWILGQVGHLQPSVQSAGRDLAHWAQHSQADFLLLWEPDQPLPQTDLILALTGAGLDLAHYGLMQGLADVWPDLFMAIQNWSMINGSEDHASSSWRLGLQGCLIRRDLILQLGSLDAAFISLRAAGLELGYRCTAMGAVVEYRPELWPSKAKLATPTLPIRDFYTFILRYCGNRWATYVAFRRSQRRFAWRLERKALREAQRACKETPGPSATARPVWYDATDPRREVLAQNRVSVVIPTIGRYPYLPQALDSLRGQTIPPSEVIIVDQNPVDMRQPQIYENYADLNIRVIWQDKRGQSLARNSGLAAVAYPYVLFFDDDSIAEENLIQAHLQVVVNDQSRVSTGVSYPPPPDQFHLPTRFQYFRIAQTLDTGNSLLATATARQMGGLDRNYDFGPGTDVDFGTRLYLAGLRIIHNPLAQRIHFKAPVGGLRLYGVNKYNTDRGLLKPFPPVTQSYYGQRYLTAFQRRERALLQFVTSKFPRPLRSWPGLTARTWSALAMFSIGFLLLPLKFHLASRQARILLKQGVWLATFELTSGRQWRPR